jgi:hypothetical protein
MRITLIVICWVRAPCSVRFPPKLLRLTIAGRRACSARQFVAWTPGLGQEREHVLAFVLKVGEQAAVGLMGGAHPKQLVGPLVQVAHAQVQLAGVDHLALVAQRERVLEDPSGGVRDARLPSDRVGDQLAGPPQQTRMRGLVLGIGELPIGRPPIALQHPREVRAENPGGVLVPAATGDHVHGDVLAAERPQPRLLSVDSPAGLIRCNRPAGADPSISA